MIAFVVELIFVFVETNTFLRSYATDTFAVIYVYFALRFCDIPLAKSLAITLLVAYGIEVFQYFNFFDGSENIFIILVLGGTYDCYDFIAYNIGLFLVVLIEYWYRKNPC